jgi:hypothetical protein
MARTRTRAELVAEAKDRADMENSEHVSDTQWARYVNQSAAALYDEIADEFEGDFASTTSISTVAGTSTYSLGATFYRLASVPPYVSIGGSQRRLLPMDIDAVPSLLNAGNSGWSTGQLYYRLINDDKIQILPAPDGVYTLTVWFIPAFQDMSGDASTYDGRNGWEEWVVLDAAIKAIMKEEGDASGLVAERDAKLARLKARMRHKDSAPRRVRDVTRGDRYWPWEW